MAKVTRNVNWNEILDTPADYDIVEQFARNNVSGTELYNSFTHIHGGGEVRHLLRQNGVVYARRLVRKALRRRGLVL